MRYILHNWISLDTNQSPFAERREKGNEWERPAENDKHGGNERVQERRTKEARCLCECQEGKQVEFVRYFKKGRKQLSISVKSQGRLWHTAMSWRHHYNMARHTRHVHVGVDLLQAQQPTQQIQFRSAQWSYVNAPIINTISAVKHLSYPVGSYCFISVPACMFPFHGERLRNVDQSIVQQLSNDTTVEQLRVTLYNVYKEGH